MESSTAKMSVQTPEWVRDAVFYQIFPDRFARGAVRQPDITFEAWDSPPSVYGFKGGDLHGVTDRLEYLANLGITAIYLNPVFSSAANHRYHTYDYFQVDPLLGGNAALRRLLDEAHQRGIRVILDGVFNHSGRGFWQFHHVLENGRSSPFCDWFHFDPERLNGHQPFLPYPDDHAAAALKNGVGSFEAIGYSAWWNLPGLPKFNVQTPAVREFLFSVAEHWIRFGIDGWRLDVPNEIDDDDFWREFRRRVRQINPQAYIVGEIWGSGQKWLQGDMWDAVMNYQITAACLGFFGGDRLDLDETRRLSSFGHVRSLTAREFADELHRVESLYQPEVNQAQLNLLDSHDTPRFLTCVRNDQAALRMAWLLLCTLPGAPCVYYGDEIGLDGRHDPDCRKSFPWETSRWDTSLLDWYRSCIELRKLHPALRHGERTTLIAEYQVYVSLHQSVGDCVIAVFNGSPEEQQISLNSDNISCLATTWHQWPDGRTISHEEPQSPLRFSVPARTAWVLSTS